MDLEAGAVGPGDRLRGPWRPAQPDPGVVAAAACDRPLFYACVAASSTMGEEGTERPAAGLVGTDEAVRQAIRDVGALVASGDAASVLAADPDVTVVLGEAAAVAVARHRPTVPILPVAAGTGLRPISPTAVGDALARYAGDDWQTIDHPLVSVTVDGRNGGADGDGGKKNATALLDACLVTAEPARISEYTVAVEGRHVATVRADGVVAATPAGTRGYARSIGSPVVPPGPEVLSVAPIAPFQTDPETWVLPDDQVTVTVERDETPVAVLADDRRVAAAGAGASVELARVGSLRTVVVPESASPFARGDAELEKH